MHIKQNAACSTCRNCWIIWGPVQLQCLDGLHRAVVGLLLWKDANHVPDKLSMLILAAWVNTASWVPSSKMCSYSWWLQDGKEQFFLGTESSWIEIKEDKHGIWEYDAIRKESYLLFILLFLSYFFFLFRETVNCRHLPWILGGCAGWRLSCTDMRCCWLWLPHFFLEDSDKRLP